MKYKFDVLEVEITRKCQLKCMHCFRGDAQPIDMSKEVIDCFLDKTEAIHNIIFTGGEPLCNFAGMIYFMTQVANRNIPVEKIEIVTNGIIQDDFFSIFINTTYNYLERFRKPDDKDPMIVITVSADLYHKNNADKAFCYYRDEFKDYKDIFVLKSSLGNLTIAEGRAKNISYAFHKEVSFPHKVEFLTKTHTPACPHLDELVLDNDDQCYVVCGLYLSAKGDLLILSGMPHEYDRMDVPNRAKVCNILETENLLDEIIEFNKGKMHCLASKVGEYARKSTDEYKENLNKTAEDEYSPLKAKLLQRYIDERERLQKYTNSNNRVFDVKDYLDMWIDYKNKFHCDAFGEYVGDGGNEEV